MVMLAASTYPLETLAFGMPFVVHHSSARNSQPTQGSRKFDAMQVVKRKIANSEVIRTIKGH